MIVYRLCNKKEIQEILNTKSFTNIGSINNNNSKLNNHTYIINQKYLHFFKDYDSLFYLYLKPKSNICIYNIPDILLEKYRGEGKYLDRLSMKRIDKVIEYAIPNYEIEFTYLQKIDKVIDNIDFFDYIEMNYNDKLETIYEINKKIIIK